MHNLAENVNTPLLYGVYKIIIITVKSQTHLLTLLKLSPTQVSGSSPCHKLDLHRKLKSDVTFLHPYSCVRVTAVLTLITDMKKYEKI